MLALTGGLKLNERRQSSRAIGRAITQRADAIRGNPATLYLSSQSGTMSYMGLTKPPSQTARTKLSTKGQLILPKSIRSAHDWQPGTEFSVEDRRSGILLRPVRRRGITRWEDLVGLARYKGRSRTIREMDAAIEAEGRRRR